MTEEKQKIRTFRDLLIWQKSIKLVTQIYEVTKIFPKEEAFGLTSQMRRCAVSIPSNIAEGHGRNSTRDYLRFLQIATGSLYELQTQLVIANNLSFFSEEAFISLEENAREIERMLSSFVRKLSHKII
jgi:four helix bundle protein